MIWFFFFIFAVLSAEEKGVVVDLRRPTFQNGVLETTQGGVVNGPRFRLQAQKITYTKTAENHVVEAEDSVMIEAGDYLFVGDRLFYDFEKETGIIYNGRTAQPPWYLGGEEIELMPSGDYIIRNAFITTSDTLNPDWQINAKSVTLNRNHQVKAEDLYGKIFRLNLLWFPRLNVNLESLTDQPIRFSAKWGGKQGGRLGVIYNFLNWGRFKAFLRLDYRLNRGPGAGIETYYLSEDHREYLETINYVARDNAIPDPHENIRYRFQGVYQNSLFDDTVTVDASWDKLSDKEMATDYNDRGLELDEAGRTELLVRRQEENWITEFRTKIKVNQFQTIKQELPALFITHRPAVIGRTGIITENSLEASYLDFSYANDVIATDYNSTRADFISRFYRPFNLDPLTVTPEVGYTGIVYGNSPSHTSKFLSIGFMGVNAKTSFYRATNCFKHVITPYFDWQYFTFPTVNPDKHYIFDIDDGLYRMECFKVGTKNDFIKKDGDTLKRLFEVDVYTFLFVNKIPLPKLYTDFTTRSSPNLKHTLTIAYDYQQQMLDQFNIRNDWTVNRDIALSLEYRHRSPYAYRKCVRDNYMLETFRSTRELVHSSVSDRRDTLLFHAFWRFHPLYAIEFTSRSGWNRRYERDYSEYEIDFLTQLKSHWLIKVSYQHKEEDDRVAIYFNLLSNEPSRYKNCLDRPIEF